MCVMISMASRGNRRRKKEWPGTSPAYIWKCSVELSRYVQLCCCCTDKRPLRKVTGSGGVPRLPKLGPNWLLGGLAAGRVTESASERVRSPLFAAFANVERREWDGWAGTARAGSEHRRRRSPGRHDSDSRDKAARPRVCPLGWPFFSLPRIGTSPRRKIESSCRDPVSCRKWIPERGVSGSSRVGGVEQPGKRVLMGEEGQRRTGDNKCGPLCDPVRFCDV